MSTNRIVGTLDKYIFSQFFGPFSLAVGGFLVIAMIDILYYLMDLLIISNVNVGTLLKILLLKLPEIMMLFFPMAVLFSTMLLLIRMIKDNELTILRASGISLVRIIRPLLIACTCVTLVSFYFYDSVVPKTNHLFQQILFQEVKKKPPPIIEENIFFKVLDERFFYIKRINKKTNQFFDILIFQKKARLPVIITAEEGIWNSNEWVLKTGKTFHFQDNGDISYTESFDQLKINTEQEAMYYFRKHKTPREMNSQELKNQISLLNKSGLNTRSLKVQYHFQKSIPVSGLVFGVLGIALCLSIVSSGKDWWGIIIAICGAVLSVGFYFFLVALFRSLSKNGDIIPLLGAWTPNILYITLSSFILVRTLRVK